LVLPDIYFRDVMRQEHPHDRIRVDGAAGVLVKDQGVPALPPASD
jgi:hypothetical protein